MQSAKVSEIFGYCRELFGNAPKVELNYKTDIELIVAVILSAQCTDKRVNEVTKELFRKYCTVKDFAQANQEDFERDIHSCGFYHNKATSIINMARIVIKDFGGVIPDTIDDLVKLPGVGRKTANVFLAEFFGKPAIAVDTHVIRVSGRLGLTQSKNPDVIERDLAKLVDEQNWRLVNLYLVLFGRYKCKAVKPQCNACKVKKYCLYCKSDV